ncbi:MAG: hypothetical protein L3J36_03080 [Rhodobacteraceae bacterium]|nr:hypothetical protein [Paracoccaceae bacterium]
MAAYLVVSLITGFTFAAVSFLWYGVPLWAMGLFYIAGCWSGFAVTLVVFLLIGLHDDDPKGTRWTGRRITR